jgi:hypothetical protein
MSRTQAEEFARRLPIVVAQYNDTSSSFSATVFAAADGQLHLAIRGTKEPLGDIAPTDANIGLYGVGFDQVVAMVNWWRRATAGQATQVAQVRMEAYPPTLEPSTTNAVYIYTDTTSSPVPMRVYVVPDVTVPGTGELVNASAADPRVNVSGHSLGGHLAMAFEALFSSQTEQVFAFNAPGFKDTPENRAFFSTLGGAFPSGGTTINVIADESAIGDRPWSAIAGLHSRPGLWVNVGIENQWNGDEPVSTRPGALNHSQQVLSDALAVYALVGKLDGAISTTQFKQLLSNSATGTAASLERVVDSLEMTLGRNSEWLPVGNDQREALYQAILGLIADPSFVALTGKTELRPLTSSTELLQTAKTDFGEFIALKTLAPFALRPKVDPNNATATAAAADALTGVWVTAHGADYTAWLGDRQARMRGELERENTFSDQWYADRAAMLGYVLKANEQNIDYAANNGRITGQPIATPTRFEDRTSGIQFTVSLQSLSEAAVGVRNVVFGTATGDPDIDGRAGVDALYGEDGDDTLRGLAGNDYLEGGRGADTLFGGADRDFLLGGEGADVYKFNAGDGHDVVRDKDGGRIDWSGASIGAARRVAPGVDVWESGADGHRLTLIGQTESNRGTLLIQQLAAGVPVAGDSIRIEAFDLSSAFATWGLLLQESVPIPPPNIATSGEPIEGDRKPLDIDPVAPGEQRGNDEFGNLRTEPTPEPDRRDDLYDRPGNDLIDGKGGDDYINAFRGGADFLRGGTGNDVVLGGSGDDLVDGEADNDRLNGDSGNDFIRGDAGSDYIEGNARIDDLRGGNGVDLVPLRMQIFGCVKQRRGKGVPCRIDHRRGAFA